MKCPQCNAEGTLTISFMYQISHDYKIKRDGTLPKKYKISGEHTLEWSCINCSNCGMCATDVNGDYYDGDNGEVVFNLRRISNE